ncbi:MAG: FG-GAP-like repeat-containing protein, partial [Gemmataceae bacterium]|nr:FG-GAP-like repeat-containing protein [Gemmataceae bacterium]
MNVSSLKRPRFWVPAALVLLAAGGVAAWLLWPTPPRPGTARHEQFSEAFWIGTAAVEGGLVSLGERKLTEAISIYRGEPAAWANRGLGRLRAGRLEDAAKDLEEAARLAPANADIKELLSLLRERQQRMEDAIRLARDAAASSPSDTRRQYRVVDLLVKQGNDEADAEQQSVLERILALRPNSLVVLTQLLVLAQKRGDAKSVEDVLARLGKLSSGWKTDTRQALLDVRKALKEEPGAFPAAFNLLRNRLTQEAGFLQSSVELKPTGDSEGDELRSFIKLENMRAGAAPPDTGLALPFVQLNRLERDAAAKGWDALVPAWLETRSAPTLWAADAKEARRIDGRGRSFPFPSGARKVAPSQQGILLADLDNDGFADLVLAGAGGLRFWMRLPDGGWEDATGKTKLAKEILEGDWWGVWAVDYDQDADLDLVLAPRDGPAVLLRNNADGTFTPMKTFGTVRSPRAFAWADLDGDGINEASFLDAAGKAHVFLNRRSGQFEPAKPLEAAKALALAAGALGDDGRIGLVMLDAAGKVRRTALVEDRWETAELASMPALAAEPGQAALFVADMDNNAAFDLVVRTATATTVFLNDGNGAFSLLDLKDVEGKPASTPGGLAPPFDYDGDGLLDLAGLNAGNRWPVFHAGKGTRDYRWHQVRLLADASGQAVGDQRINTFNLGGEVQMRTGRLVLRQPIIAPVTHFGLGTNKRAHLTRILMTNGQAQWEFDRPASSYMVAEQRLKGSCPFLYSWDGERIVFVADFLWSTPLGMYINGQDKGGFLQTTDWTKIRGGQLKPRGGVYDLRVNANLWETHYIDEQGLLLVDHPAGTEMHVDERFFLTPTPPRLYLTEKPKPVAKAWDHKGRDATDLVRERDGRYLDRAGRGKYQGITRDHWVEIDLGDDAPKTGETYLLATGWLHPTDSSINFALAQQSAIKPVPLSLEVPDGKGGWKTGRPALGFPAGKDKTLVIRLDGIEGEGKVSRR